MITITENAADQIKKLQSEMDGDAMVLRLAVDGGGCCGYQYSLGFDAEKEGDSRFDSNGVSMVVDGRSIPMLNGIELDYVDGPYGSNFVFKNPNPAGGCGCG